MADPTTVDASGKFCPVPIVELARAMRGLPDGAEVLLLATDPAVCADLEAWCRSTGNELLGVEQGGGVYRGRVRKRGR